METHRFKFGSFIKGILIGGVIAAGVALFTAPRSGSETRQILREKGEHLREQAMETLGNTRERVDSAIIETRRRADHLMQRIGKEEATQAAQAHQN